ncbi:hypothetical protein BN946_scf184873.g14 [Trametes cinnabarina]|uniref:Protein-S-isoprenylcysteine O-methyltransferase n=1 Tax=Pycnoporus cinnabarinus TaxID=5643 RepID=A0A060SNG5_PYCCI|nr:hypothetical protein BN946_scf184873.g14 [Trametes cinnabarina]
MSIFPAPALATPLLKVPLLLGNAVCTYYGLTPAQPLPKEEEQKRYEKPDIIGRTLRAQVALITVSKWLCCCISLAEAAAILAQHFPSPISDRVLHLLVPSPNASLGITPATTVACAMGIAGGLTRMWCYRTLGNNFTWSMSIQQEHKLGTSGPYAIVRHPSYTAWTIMVLGNFALLLSKGSYFVEAGWLRRPLGKIFAGSHIGYMTFVTLHLLSRAHQEDVILKEEFGEQWEKWSKRTPYRLVPYIY